MSPADLAWWVWLLVAIAASLVAKWLDNKGHEFSAGTFGILALICGVIAAIRFVKWVWAA